MLSYQHIYHAGNPADVHKHLWLITVLDYLQQKDKPLNWIDTHGGRGLYDLQSPEAQKLSEYKTGFLKIFDAYRNEKDLPAPLRLYLDLITQHNPEGALRSYPGSALIAASLLRQNDTVQSYDLHPQEFTALQKNLAPYKNAHVQKADGLAALKSLLPPPAKRGGLLIDPSYEIKSEYEQVVAVLKAALKRWAGGVYMVWYPLLPAGHHAVLAEKCRALTENVIIDEWHFRAPGAADRGLYGSGMVIINPPYTCAETMDEIRKTALPLLLQN